MIVKRETERQGFYLHEVEVKEKLADAFKTPTEGSASPASKLIISQLIDKINRQHQKKSKKSDGIAFYITDNIDGNGELKQRDQIDKEFFGSPYVE